MAVKPSVVFFGTGPVAAASLESLLANFTVEAVITKQSPPHHKNPAPVLEIASSHNLPTFFANTRTELDTVIDGSTFLSAVGIIVDYGVIVSQTVINSFPLGIINSHFSLLPRWRGADPISFSILKGDDKTGVSLMIIEPTLDTGKIIVQKSIPISPDDTTPSLTNKLITLSNTLLSAYIPKYITGSVSPRRQPHPDRATYSRKLTKADGIIDHSKTALEIEREVRAFYGWPNSRTIIFNQPVIVLKAHVGSQGEKGLILKCSDNTFLVIDELIGPSGKKMSGPAFLNGYNKTT